MHPNVPLQIRPGQHRRYRIIHKVAELLSKCLWMVCNILAPEWAFAKAWADNRAVASLREEYNRLKDVDSVPWDDVHSYFANMGGFAVSFEHLKGSDSSSEEMPSKLPSVTISSSVKQSDSLQGSQDHQLSATSATADDRQGELREAGEDLESMRITPLIKSFTAPASTRTVKTTLPQLTRPRSEPVPDANIFVDDDSLFCYTESHIPVQIKMYLARERYKVYADTARRVQGLFGELDWSYDVTNTQRANRAIKTIDFSHFETDWERRRFLDSWMHWSVNVSFLQGSVWILDANQLLLARKLGIVSLPNIEGDAIRDRSKADVFVKALALVQILYFIFQLCMRWAQHLPVSQLEIASLAIAASMVFTYILLLDKPKDVARSISVEAHRRPTVKELSRLAVVGPRYYTVYRLHPWIPNNAIHACISTGQVSVFVLLIGASFSVSILGGLHCIAWNFAFPTLVESRLWQASSVVTLALLPVWLLIVSMNRSISRIARKNISKQPKARTMSRILAGNFLGSVFMFVLVAARVYTVVEALRTLAFLPAEAYLNTSSDEFPHVG